MEYHSIRKAPYCYYSLRVWNGHKWHLWSLLNMQVNCTCLKNYQNPKTENNINNCHHGLYYKIFSFLRGIPLYPVKAAKSHIPDIQPNPNNETMVVMLLSGGGWWRCTNQPARQIWICFEALRHDTTTDGAHRAIAGAMLLKAQRWNQKSESKFVDLFAPASHPWNHFLPSSLTANIRGRHFGNKEQMGQPMPANEQSDSCESV